METDMIDNIVSLSQTLLRIRNREFKRYFLRDHSLSNRFSIIVGQRGIGKTTAMIQHLLGRYGNDIYNHKSLYIQADHFLVFRSSLYEIADEFYKLGGELICFDEIHKYPDWSMELKSIHDTFPNLKILASGSSALEITRGSHDLSRRAIGVIMTISRSGKGLRELEKPEKVYLNNPNLYHALAGGKAPGIGAMRETFFLNMLGVNHSVSVPVKGDFLVNDEITFEVGGKNKDSSQIKNTENAWLALDNIEIGQGIRIPLWLFGYLY